MLQLRVTKRTSAARGGGLPAAAPTKTAIFTIVSRNYISYAATLMQSVAEHQPDAARYIFLADEPSDFTGLELQAEVVTADSIGIANFGEMAFRYSVVELNTAVKPFCFDWLFQRSGHRRAIYLDPDILMLRSLDEVTKLLDAGANIVLTPHITEPLQDGCQPDDLTIMKSGIYNLGFAALADTEPARRFLQWWGERLEHHCRVEITNHLFVDQRWMDLAPALVPDTAILRHPGYNVAYWNLAHRPITFDPATGWQAAGQPLCFVHFSGVEPHKPLQFSKHQNRFSIHTIGGLRPLYESYLKKLRGNGYDAHIDAPYAYERFKDGRHIHWLMRNYFRRIEDNEGWPSEVSRASDSAMFDEPEPSMRSPGLPDLTRLMYQLWLERRDLQLVFPLDTAQSRTAYLMWFVESGPAETSIDDQSLLAAAALGGRAVKRLLPARLHAEMPRPEPLWAEDEPWQGPASQADRYIRGRVRLRNGAASLPRQFAIAWNQRADLQEAFQLRSADEIDAYIEWCLTDGVAQNQVTPELIDAAFWEELNAPAEVAQRYDDIPISRGLWILYPRCEQRDAVAQFPAERRSRIRLALWLLLEAPQIHHWPPELSRRLRKFAAERVAGPPGTIALPRLVLMLWEVRDDLRTAFDPEDATGRLRLLHWFLFHGLAEHGLTFADLPDYLRQALAEEPLDEENELPLLYRLILVQRKDVAQVFDVTTPEGRRGYLEWFARYGVAELDTTGLRGLRSPQDEAAPAPAVHATAHVPAIVLTGCPSDASGRGEDIRMTMAALDAHRIPYLTLNRRDGTLSDNAGNSVAPAAAADAAVNIVHLNADTAVEDYLFLRQYGFHRARVVGYWAWELAKFPRQYVNAFSFFDEIWASTRFAYEAFDTGYRPVTLMPMPVELPHQMPELTRRHFRIPEDRFLFLFNFDFSSFVGRKNPLAAIAAFHAAFPKNNRVALIIKTLNAERFPEQWDALKAAVHGDRRIIMRNGRYTREEMLNLIRRCDCYVSLHRSEGFGRGPAEAMLLGRPVVATNYSGNMDFMNGENSFPVDYRLVPVREGEYPGAEDQVWAEPDLEHAAAQLRRVYEAPAEAALVGERARRFMQANYNAQTIGHNYAQWLKPLVAAARRAGLLEQLDQTGLAEFSSAAAAQ